VAKFWERAHAETAEAGLPRERNTTQLTLYPYLAQTLAALQYQLYQQDYQPLAKPLEHSTDQLVKGIALSILTLTPPLERWMRVQFAFWYRIIH